MSVMEYIDLVRKNWSIGQCNGNDALILLMNNSFHISYGSIIKRLIGKECSTRLVAHQNHNQATISSLKQTIFLLREFLLDPCLCRPCSTVYYWLKIPAMLLGCVFLLTWIGLVGRRALVRRKHIFTGNSIIGAAPRGGCVGDNGQSLPDFITPTLHLVRHQQQRHRFFFPPSSRDHLNHRPDNFPQINLCRSRSSLSTTPHPLDVLPNTARETNPNEVPTNLSNCSSSSSSINANSRIFTTPSHSNPPHYSSLKGADLSPPIYSAEAQVAVTWTTHTANQPSSVVAKHTLSSECHQPSTSLPSYSDLFAHSLIGHDYQRRLDNETAVASSSGMRLGVDYAGSNDSGNPIE